MVTILLNQIHCFNLSHLQTPPKFDWSIEEMASLLPAHIDQEEILRQSFFLSQTRYAKQHNCQHLRCVNDGDQIVKMLYLIKAKIRYF